jgi:hypothetical protein
LNHGEHEEMQRFGNPNPGTQWLIGPNYVICSFSSEFSVFSVVNCFL